MSLLKNDYGRYYYYYDDYTEYYYGCGHRLGGLNYCFGSSEAREQHKVFYKCQDISLHWNDWLWDFLDSGWYSKTVMICIPIILLAACICHNTLVQLFIFGMTVSTIIVVTLPLTNIILQALIDGVCSIVVHIAEHCKIRKEQKWL